MSHSVEDDIDESCDYDELPIKADTPELADQSSAPNSFEFPSLWGTLVSLDTEMEHIELRETEYVFGRDYTMVDCVLKHSSVTDINFSKKHFTIGFNGANREAYIIDNSTNGTFIGSERLKKDTIHSLIHLSRISVISDKNKVFMFLEERKYEDVRSSLSESILSKYFICDTVGKGSFGTVWLCVKKANKYQLAMKEIQSCLDDENKKYFANEVNNLKTLSHPNIVNLYDSMLLNSNIYMFLEYIPDGDLKRKLEVCKKLNEQTCKCIIYQIALALQYLHSINIVHRDLKPANILLKTVRQTSEDTMIVKVCDFGLSKNVDAQSSLKSKVGTPMFAAPEILFSNRYDRKVDVWSLGVILYLCLSGKYPFPWDAEFPGGRFYKVLSQAVNLRAPCWAAATAQVKNLILRTIVFNAAKRYDVRDLLMHAWITNDQAMINSVDVILRKEWCETDKPNLSSVVDSAAHAPPNTPGGDSACSSRENSAALLSSKNVFCGN